MIEKFLFMLKRGLCRGFCPFCEYFGGCKEEIESERREKDENERCPVGGINRRGKVDRISIQNAVETPFWMAVWATEPEREIDVRMSYDDLKTICDLVDKERERNEERGK